MELKFPAKFSRGLIRWELARSERRAEPHGPTSTYTRVGVKGLSWPHVKPRNARAGPLLVLLLVLRSSRSVA